MKEANATLRVKPPTSEAVVEIITISPIMIGHCEHCEILGKTFGVDFKASQIEEYPEELLKLSSKITEFIRALSRKYYVKVIIIEAFTLRGLYKMVKYRSGKLPLIVVNGSKIGEGSDWDPQNLSEKAYMTALSQH